MTRAELTGKRVLVTGASRGVGLGIARGFAKAGARLQILADHPQVMEVARELGAGGHLCDITKAGDVEATLTKVGRLDVLVNNAGLERITPLDDQSPEAEATFRRIVEINVVGTYLVTRAALPRMADGGAIINTASVWSRTAAAEFAAYVASKHATIGLTKSWAKELGPRRIPSNQRAGLSD